MFVSYIYILFFWQNIGGKDEKPFTRSFFFFLQIKE